MAVLEKLQIQGIRSFGTDCQSIEFEPPFSLILGQNGCGKTTIIESLKYVITGTLPFGQGSSFIRDPKLDQNINSHGQVKLQFCSAQGKILVVTRSLQATQKYKKLEVKTSDCTVSAKENNKLKQISTRCIDMDEYMSIVFGVSKPILSYVIFCHQEDSHWPLDEGKKVKERFDEIFDATKYNKCLMKIIDLRKDIVKEINQMKTAIEFLKDNMNNAVKKRRELEEKERRYSSLEDEVKAIDSQIKIIDQQYDSWYTKQRQFADLDKTKDSLKISLQTCLEHQQAERKEIIDLFPGSKQELEDTIEDLESQLDVKKKRSCDTALEIKKIKVSEGAALSQASELKKEIGRLESERQQGDNLLRERNSKINQLALQCDLMTLAESASEADFKELFSNVNKSCQKSQEEIEEFKKSRRKEHDDLRMEINKCLQEKAKLESEVESKDKTIRDKQSQLEDTINSLNAAEAKAGAKLKLEAKLEEAQHALEEVMKAENTEDLTKEIEELRNNCRVLEGRQKELITEVRIVNQCASTKNSLNEIEKKTSNIEENIRKSHFKSQDAIQKLLKDSTDFNIKADFDTLINRLKLDILKLTQAQSQNEKEISLLEQERKLLRKELQAKEDELSKNEEAAYDLLGRREYEAVLQAVDSDIVKVQNERSVYVSSEFLFKGYIEKLEAHNSCPLCNRHFNDDHSAENVIRTLKANTAAVPNRVEEVDTKLKGLLQKQRKLLQFKPVQDRINELRTKEIPKLKEKLKTIEDNLETERQYSAVIEGSLVVPREDLQKAEGMQTDVYDIDRNQSELKLCRKEIDRLKALLPSGAPQRDSKEVYAEQEEVQLKCNKKRDEKEALEKRLREHNDQTNRLRSEVNKLTAEVLAIEKELQGREALKEQQGELSSVIPLLKLERERVHALLKPTKEKKMAAESALKAAELDCERIVRSKEAKLKEKEKERVIVDKLRTDFMKYEAKRVPQILTEKREKCHSVEEQHRKLIQKREETEAALNNLTRDIEGFESQRSQLKRNLQYMKYENDAIEFREKLRKVEEDIGNIDIAGIRQKLCDLNDERENLMDERSSKSGVRRELAESIRYSKNELETAPLLNAEKKYADKLIDLTVKKYVEKDLQSYFKAVEYAMQNFHKDRMNSINKIIRELWRQIYRGNDIEYIEIKTDEIATPTATSGLDKRRSYNYRVVQVKNGTELDMRGRCSAGQKVLACLIIRIALAEMFSANCGILTLDEPTTNLDKQNIASLSDAIIEIVQDHLEKKSFQLVVITHDRAFLDRMSRADFFTHYWEVSRCHRSTSVVKRVDLDK